MALAALDAVVQVQGPAGARSIPIIEFVHADMERVLDTGFVPNTAIRPGRSQRGDAAAAIETAPVKVQQIYRTPIEHHNPMSRTRPLRSGRTTS